MVSEAAPRAQDMMLDSGGPNSSGSCDEAPLIRAQHSRRPDDDYSTIVAWQVCKSRRRTIAAVALGAAAVLCCGLAATGGAWAKRTPATAAAAPAKPVTAPLPISARRLMESPELAEVAADNVLALRGGEAHPGERELLRESVRSHFRNTSARISEQNPEAARQLDEMQLSPEQRGAVLEAMRGLRDPRLRQLGQEIAGVVGASVFGSPKQKAAAKRHLLEYLKPRVHEVRQLHDEVTPPLLRELEDGEELDLEELDKRLDEIRLFQAASVNNWDVEFEVTPGGRRLGLGSMMADGASNSFEMYAQMDQFWDKLRTVGKKFKLDLPPFSKVVQSVDMKTLMQCFMTTSMHPMPSSIKQCGMEFMTAAENVMQVCFGKDVANNVPNTNKLGR